MIDIREILIRLFSAMFLSMCTGSFMFVFWMVLRKIFADKIHPKVYDVILKIILIAYYLPAGYLVVDIFFDNGYVFSITGIIVDIVYSISLFWLAGVIVTVLKFGERTFRIREEKASCFECKKHVQDIFEECKRELGIHRPIELLQGYRIQTPMVAGLLKPCVFLPVEDMDEEQLKMCLYHELTHYKKHDIFWSYIACLMVCIHWYCPWTRIAFQKIDEWSEVMCDLSSIGYVGSMKQYFTTIFEMCQKNQGIKPYMAACLFESQDSLEHRIYYAKMYRNQKKIKYVTATIAMTIIFCGLSVTATFAAGKGYQKIYTKWVQATEVEIEILDAEDLEYKEMDEIKGELQKTTIEKTVKVNLKGDSVASINHTINEKGRIRYKNLYVKKGQKIDISTARDANGHKIRIGISHNGKNFRYVEDEGEDKVDHIFNIEDEGKYDVYIENLSDKKLKIVGYLAIDLEEE